MYPKHSNHNSIQSAQQLYSAFPTRWYVLCMKFDYNPPTERYIWKCEDWHVQAYKYLIWALGTGVLLCYEISNTMIT